LLKLIKKTLITIFLGFLLICINNNFCLAKSWPLPRHDSQNSGSSLATGSPVASIRWIANLKDKIYSEPVVDSMGNVYITAGGYLYGFGREGSQIFAPVSLKEEVYEQKNYCPIILSPDEETLYLGLGTTGGAALAAYNAKEGTKKCFYDDLEGDSVSSLTRDEEGVLYLGADEGMFFALVDCDTGIEKKWEYKNEYTDSYTYPYPALIHGNKIILIAKRGTKFDLIALDKESGNQQWKYDRSELIAPAVLSRDGSKLYVPCNGYIFIDDISNGRNVGYYKLSSGISGQVAPIAVDAAGRIIVLAHDRLHCVDPEGNGVWIFSPEDSIITTNMNSGPVVDKGGNIYFGDRMLGDGYGTLYAVDPWGYLEWSYKTKYNITGSPVIAPDGTIIFGGGNNLYALRGEEIFLTPKDGACVYGKVPFIVDTKKLGVERPSGVLISVQGSNEWNQAAHQGDDRYYWEWEIPDDVSQDVQVFIRVIDKEGRELQNKIQLCIKEENIPEDPKDEDSKEEENGRGAGSGGSKKQRNLRKEEVQKTIQTTEIDFDLKNILFKDIPVLEVNSGFKKFLLLNIFISFTEAPFFFEEEITLKGI
jgi:outer membrane protein assembly factor BamB